MKTIHKSEMLEDLRCVYAQDPEATLRQIVTRSLADPVKPEYTNGRYRVHPLVVLLGASAAIALAAFVFFSFFQP